MPLEKALPCPFCGKDPIVLPETPEEGGTAWAQVECVNPKCPSKPKVKDGEEIADDRGSDAYKRIAISRWNQRSYNRSSHLD